MDCLFPKVGGHHPTDLLKETAKNKVLGESAVLIWARPCLGPMPLIHCNGNASSPRMRLRRWWSLPLARGQMWQGVQLGVFTKDWPAHRTSSCGFLLLDIYSLRLLTFQGLLLRLDDSFATPVLYIINALRLWLLYTWSFQQSDRDPPPSHLALSMYVYSFFGVWPFFIPSLPPARILEPNSCVD